MKHWQRIALSAATLLSTLMLSAAQSAAPDEIVFRAIGLQPEGVEWDAARERWLVGSLSRGTIHAIDDEGTLTPIIEDEEVGTSVGIHIDTASDRLLVPISDASVFFNPQSKGRAALAAYDLESGERLFLTDMSDLISEGQNFANDVTVDSEGNAYVTNSFAPVIYKVTPTGEASIFVEDARLGADFFGLNGIDVHPDGYLLAAVGDGMVKIPLDDPSDLSVVSLDAAYSIDGLVVDAEGQVFAVANLGEDEQRIVQLVSEDDWASASAAASVETTNAATTLALRDGVPYYVNCYLNNPIQPEYQIVRAVLE